MTDYSHSDDTGQCWTSDFAGTSVRLTVEYPDEILSGGGRYADRTEVRYEKV